jgi:Flp pilus assembly protein TadG
VLVEFAFVLPILVLFVFGIVEFGRGYNARLELGSAVREGARAAAVGGTTVDAATVTQRTRDAAPGLTTADITVNATLCVGTPAPVNAQVAATYPFHYDIPLLGSRTANLTAKGVMRCGG